MNLNKIGKLGEDIACRFVSSKGFTVIERNYLKKGGEIDIIAIKAGLYHFIEVKSVSREIVDNKPIKGDFVEPFENMHRHKVKRLRNSIVLYLEEKHVTRETFSFDLCIVYVDESARKAAVNYFEDLPLSVE